MALFWGIIDFALFAFLLLLIGRLIFDWVQYFARDWRPSGVVLVIAEAIYTVTDPPLRVLRRVIPPLRLGSVQLDLAFMVLFFLVVIAQSIVRNLAAATM
ncbi:YggT family protein [Myceligenerans salitolerans]|uniref:YggT family protein n=1 Tax=Myceligenerans salitolerans TaxID=1230528 RepID=A0ABS3I417_9MICO|nr:YggT family protein [Myceligenerans salitolerans]MBO0607715.1 YggT family protein [Myceligenerans salitolerans]